MQGGSKKSGAGGDAFLQLLVCNYLNNSYTLKSKLVLCYQVELLVHLLCYYYILPAIMLLLYIYYIDQLHNIWCICGVCYVVLRYARMDATCLHTLLYYVPYRTNACTASPVIEPLTSDDNNIDKGLTHTLGANFI